MKSSIGQGSVGLMSYDLQCSSLFPVAVNYGNPVVARG